MDAISPFSLAAALAYVATAVLALIAAFAVPGRRRATMRDWSAVGAIFLALALWRFTNGEAQVQDYWRSLAQLHGTYEYRHDWQAPVTVAMLLAGVVIGIAGFRWAGRRRAGQALCAAVAMVLFVGLRTISLHAVDGILYRALGPIHLNYVIDLGLTALTATLAMADCGWLGTPRARRPRSSR